MSYKNLSNSFHPLTFFSSMHIMNEQLLCVASVFSDLSNSLPGLVTWFNR